MTAVHAVIIGGPRSGEGITVERERARWGVTMMEGHAAAWEDVDPTATPTTAIYRLVSYAPVVGLTMNLLVRSSIAERDLHDHLGVLFTDAAQAAIAGG